jgi:hypothetical protein
VAAAAAVALTPVAASAGQIDNEGDEGVLVHFTCGVTCGTYVGANAGESIWVPDVDGQVQGGVAVQPDSNDTPWMCEVVDLVSIAADGHLSLVFDGGKQSSGDVQVSGRETFTWASVGDGPKVHVTHVAEERGGGGQWCWAGGPG